MGQSPDRPNVLFIFLDDMGWRDCGFTGSDYYQTPNIDALANRGMIFTNAYAGAANCAPSRACLLSGQYSPRHEIYNVGTRRRGKPKFGKLKHVPGTDTLRPDIRTWADQIRDAGYRTGSIGKWHLSDDPTAHGFDFSFAGSRVGNSPRGYFPPYARIDDLRDAPAGEYLTDRLTNEAIEFIKRNADRPWLLYLSHYAVHTPLQAKPDLIAKHQGRPKGQLHDHAVMAAMIESVDVGIGRIIDQLASLGLTEKTAIVFTSDNGGYGPATSMDPLKGYKGTYYEGGIREPFFFVWPGKIAPGTQSDVPIINIDLYPTFCGITGAQLPPKQILDGQNLVPLLTNQGELPDRAIYWHFPAYLQSYRRVDSQRDPLYRCRPCGIIRHGDWKLHEYFEDGGLELYNLRDDLGERNNVAAEQPAITRRLHSELKNWRQQTAAPVPNDPNPHFDADAEAAAIAKINRENL